MLTRVDTTLDRAVILFQNIVEILHRRCSQFSSRTPSSLIRSDQARQKDNRMGRRDRPPSRPLNDTSAQAFRDHQIIQAVETSGPTVGGSRSGQPGRTVWLSARELLLEQPQIVLLTSENLKPSSAFFSRFPRRPSPILAILSNVSQRGCFQAVLMWSHSHAMWS